ncbi:bile acid:sodium symporter family protein [Croceicoccus naphthovorans]|uniref:Bile acid:sodium symporter n=1 Tax=Croceicoccus naphthovorans TaxID=1348774 RepID=A0A0G3XFM7_9SPHN|nr:bile acid:sodium symporter family protein [Croceicoccus naphthovorans]AKM09158.1 bile acid:sodium symporter [Croceicoccus naphthovorans]MBB3990479.1 sodium/bile acid cotransporter 7 [Croceicoccus naphthovorans]
MLKRLKPDPFVLSLFGAIVLASLLPPRGGFATLAAWVADAGIVLLFFLHGARLSRAAIIGGLTHWRLHLVIAAATFVLFPLVTLALAYTPGLNADLARGMTFIGAVPSTMQSAVAFTAMAGGNVAGAVCAAAISNMAAVIVTPALSALMAGGSGGAEISGGAALRIIMQLLLPFVLGHLLRPVIGTTIDRHKRFIGLADKGVIVMIVYVAFGASVAEGLWLRTGIGELLLVLALCLVLLGVVFAANALAGRLLTFSREDRITIQFAGSKKSLAAGVAFAGVLFPPASVGAVLLPLMVYHQMQMIVSALLAARWAKQAQDPSGAQSD